MATLMAFAAATGASAQQTGSAASQVSAADIIRVSQLEPEAALPIQRG
ncbi:MAG: hypothetical protein AAGF29_05110 [Pseudomonadota bacterium]